MDMILGIGVLVFSAILHEVMHGVVADRLGDPTPRAAGRLTFNPIPHIDPISSILVPLLMFFGSGGQFVFAAAKPVPVNPLYLKEGRKDLALVALAGPFTNLALAGLGALFYQVIGTIPIFSDIAFAVVFYNLLLAIFNMVPIPPLDGSKFFSLFMPEKIAYQYLSIAPFGLFILFALLFFPIGGFSLGKIINELLITALNLFGVR